MLFANRVALAADLELSATVPAPIPSGAPAFTSPTEGAVVTDPLVTITGTCPVETPAVLIVVSDGTSTLGSTQCSPMGAFSLDVTLSPGTSSLVATVTTITGGQGQSSPPLTITYNAPQPTTTPSSPTAPSPSPAPPSATPTPGIGQPLDIVTDTPFIVFGPQQTATWQATFTGGRAPYIVIIDWGDGSTPTSVTINDSSLHTFEHRYGGESYYTFTVKITDLDGVTLERNFVAVNVSPGLLPVASGSLSFPRTDFLGSGGAVHLALYAAFASLLMLLLGLWRYELVFHRPHAVKHPLHYPWQRPKHHA